MSEGTPIDLAKMRSISVGTRTRPRVNEGRDADTGKRWKATTDELNNTVTERSDHKASGVSHNQDVHLRVETVRAKLGDLK